MLRGDRGLRVLDTEMILLSVSKVSGAKHCHVNSADGNVVKWWYRGLVRLGGRREGLGVW